MTLEEIKGILGDENDKFPVGMRVLAVDDDRTWLRILDELLRKCQYQVTTTSQAKAALKMLRENKNRFDLIISDVHMPDMDGFKLLELVGLEMDLPVIMLSGNGDPKLVMKGITHGACDYLVKPVRLEELRNIWQHVIRKKKFESKSENNSNGQDKGHQGDGQATSPDGTTDQNRKVSRKRKDDEEEEQEEEEGDQENGHENDDPATQKKPRVVWSIELHRKFVAAVNQLGIEKAVPKRILDMMNVEGLTRENVASHLQKYRLYLKRISSVNNMQQANLVGALGGKDPSYMRMNSLDGLGDFRTLAGPGRYPISNLSPYQTGGILRGLNSPSGMNIRSLSSSALFQPGHAHNLPTLGKLPPVVWPSNQNPSLFQIPTSLGLGPFQPGVASSSPFSHGNGQHMQDGSLFSSQTSFKVGSLNSEPFNTTVGGSNESWHTTIELPNYSPSSLSLSGPFDHDRLTPNSVRSNNSSSATHVHNGPLEFSSTNSISAPTEDSRGEIHFQAGSVGNVVRNTNQETAKRWDSNQTCSPFNSGVPANGVVSQLNQSLGQNNGVFQSKTDSGLASRPHSSAPTLVQHFGIEKPFMDPKMRSNEDYTSEQMKSPSGHVHGSYDSLDDIMNAMIKREQEGSLDGEFVFGGYTFG